jgi:hypothetical protein
MPLTPADAGPLAVLQRLRRPAKPLRPGERCDLCAIEIPEDHRHIVELDSRTLKCTCQACSLLFATDGAGAGRYRNVPAVVVSLPELALDAAQWDALQIPVGVAFFFRNSDTGAVSAFYPSPAGATESLLPLGAFEELTAQHPVLADLQPDVQALLVRADRGNCECYVVPIDVCYELVGLLRQSWRGFDGGREVHEELDELFGRLRARARDAGSPPTPAGERRG